MKINIVIAAILVVMSINSGCWADEYEIEFMAGNTSTTGGVHYQNDLSSGFVKIGGSGVYVDDEDLEYKWLSLDFTVGNATLLNGLTCEVGITGLYGDAEDNGYSSDVGTIAFTGKVGYVVPDGLLPIPLEAFGRITYAPASITFADTDKYIAYEFGGGLRIVQYASVYAKYTICDLDLIADSHAWNLADNTIQMGVIFRF